MRGNEGGAKIKDRGKVEPIKERSSREGKVSVLQCEKLRGGEEGGGTGEKATGRHSGLPFVLKFELLL